MLLKLITAQLATLNSGKLFVDKLCIYCDNVLVMSDLHKQIVRRSSRMHGSDACIF